MPQTDSARIPSYFCQMSIPDWVSFGLDVAHTFLDPNVSLLVSFVFLLSCCSLLFITRVSKVLSETPLIHQVITRVSQVLSETPLIHQVITRVSQVLSETPLIHQVITRVSKVLSETPLIHQVITRVSQVLSETPLIHQVITS
ncbi:hypothetical protein BgiMline_026305 [Biomphalaria glabrata]|nr:hypothetical protein BgiMline_020789 [Biomphalaria glabrata]KAI8767307.1 hypothetical protein BgiBS90_029455 [Biomphalaria glabrata]